MIFRFAPSPNGRIHAGHAFSALLNAGLADRHGGVFLLRLEDIDLTRCTPALAEACLDDLRWVGLTWEEPVRRQSEHFDSYALDLARLKAMRLLYPCFCTRREVAAMSSGVDPDGAPLYSGRCAALLESETAERIALGEPHAWRLRMANAMRLCPPPCGYERFDTESLTTTWVEANPSRWGDVVLARKETPTSYHLSVVVDDARQGVTHVVRGADLETATDLHVLLQRLLGLPTPLYHHHTLLKEDGLKLSKSRGSESLAALRQKGMTAEALREMLGFS